MNSVIYLWILVFIIIWWGNMSDRRNRKAQMIMEAKKKRMQGERSVMKELVKQFIGQDCVIYLMSSSTPADGVIVSVSEDGGAIMVKKPEGLEAINLDYVTRVKPIPLNKNGKRKTVW